MSAGGACPSSPIRRKIGGKSSLLNGIFQNIFQVQQASVNGAADPADPHALGPRKVGPADAEYVVGVDASGLDGRELADGRIEGGPVFRVFHYLLRGKRGKGHVHLKARGAVQGTLIMFPLAAFVAVTQAATNGEGHGDLVRHLQHDALGQVGVVVVQNDSFHSCLHFDVGWLTGRQIEMEGRRGAASGGAAPHSLWPRWPEVTGNDNARTALYCAGA